MKKLRISQIRSSIDEPKRQKQTLEALGVKKMHREYCIVATPQIEGMIVKVRHLLKVEEINE